MELFTGDAPFLTHDDVEHLAMMEVMLNRRIDKSIVDRIIHRNMAGMGGNQAAK